MPHEYDALTPGMLRRKACNKWRRYPDDVLPLWVADMDFPVAPAIREAIVAQVSENNLGYPPSGGLPGLREVVQKRLEERYSWRIEASGIEAQSGIIAGLDLACRVLSGPGEPIITQTPIYPPFLSVIANNARTPLYNVMQREGSRWEIDFEALSDLASTSTRLLLFCNPHNPTGRVFSRNELERLAEIALERDLYVVSDELHADLTYPGHRHIPLASLHPEIAARTVTLYGPTKAFNIAGLKIGFLIAEDGELLAAFKRAAGHLFQPNTLAQSATIAAYRQGDGWLADTLRYLEANRTFLADYLRRQLPAVEHAPPEGTYLAWLDFSRLGLKGELYRLLLDRCKVALNDGPLYGPGCEGFARLNFATSRGILEEALHRLRRCIREAGEN